MDGSNIAVAVFFVLGIVFVAGTLAASWMVRPHHPHPEKLASYECGERPVGPAWVQFRIIFYLFALDFVIFDVEVIYLVPWALSYKDFLMNGQGLYAVGAMLVFVVILLIGWLISWRRGCFDWE